MDVTRRRTTLAALVAPVLGGGGGILAAALAAASPPAPYREIKWSELVPKGWNPAAGFGSSSALMFRSDRDPRVLEAMRDMRAVLDNAPTVDAMEGQAVKLPGYIVPLEEVRGAVKEFLLVPYFGACIHTPPPPANQIIFVVSDPPASGFRTMDTVWVSGTMHTSRQQTFAGASGYRIEAALVERYVGAPRY